MTGYLCWFITLLFSVFEASFTDGSIVRIVLTKKRVVGGVLFYGPCCRMESNAK